MVVYEQFQRNLCTHAIGQFVVLQSHCTLKLVGFRWRIPQFGDASQDSAFKIKLSILINLAYQSPHIVKSNILNLTFKIIDHRWLVRLTSGRNAGSIGRLISESEGFSPNQILPFRVFVSWNASRSKMDCLASSKTSSQGSDPMETGKLVNEVTSAFTCNQSFIESAVDSSIKCHSPANAHFQIRTHQQHTMSNFYKFIDICWIGAMWRHRDQQKMKFWMQANDWTDSTNYLLQLTRDSKLTTRVRKSIC